MEELKAENLDLGLSVHNADYEFEGVGAVDPPKCIVTFTQPGNDEPFSVEFEMKSTGSDAGNARANIDVIKRQLREHFQKF